MKKIFLQYKKRIVNIVKNIFYTPNGVDDEIFRPIRPLSNDGSLIGGFSGNTRNHDWRKGFSEFISPAADRVGAKIVAAQFSKNNLISQKDMPEVYNRFDGFYENNTFANGMYSNS